MIDLPPHPHMPGLNARHPEAMFEPVKASALPGMEVGELAQCEAWIAGWRLLRADYFWEAHEVWEVVWLACPPNSAEKHFVGGMIQVANARLKLAMGKPDAARRIAGIAAGLLAEAAARSPGGRLLGIDAAAAGTELSNLRQENAL